jgi:hypothetical protein
MNRMHVGAQQLWAMRSEMSLAGRVLRAPVDGVRRFRHMTSTPHSG